MLQQARRAESQERVPERSTGSAIVDGFSLIAGGPIYAVQRMFELGMPSRPGVLRRALLMVLLTWAPLLIFSALHGDAFGTRVRIPFAYDFATNIRFLISLPILIAAEIAIDPKLGESVRHFVNSGLVRPSELHRYEQAIAKILRWRDSWIPTAILVAVTFAPTIASSTAELFAAKSSTWHTIALDSGHTLTLAGWWFAMIGIPIYRLLLLRWVWVLILWTAFLASVCKLRLDCVPIHPDRAAGLGFLGHTQMFWGLILFASSASTVGAVANSVAYDGASLADFKFLLPVSCALLVLIAIAPLLILTPKLFKLKEEGLLKYGCLGSAYTQAFDRKWVGDKHLPNESLLGTSDIQSLADLGNSFAVIGEMRTVLVDRELLLSLAIPVAIPILPLIFIATPADEVIAIVLRLLG